MDQISILILFTQPSHIGWHIYKKSYLPRQKLPLAPGESHSNTKRQLVALLRAIQKRKFNLKFQISPGRGAVGRGRGEKPESALWRCVTIRVRRA